RAETILEKLSGAPGPGSLGWTLISSGSGFFQFYTPPDPTHSNGSVSIGARGAITTGTWHQIVITHQNTPASDSGTIHFYYDGQVSNYGAGAPGIVIAPSPNPLLVGKPNSGDSTDSPFQGSVDQVAIWNRALTPTEVATLFNTNGVVQ